VSGIDPVETYRVFNIDMTVYTDRDNLEHALASLEPLNPKPIGEIKERELVIVNVMLITSSLIQWAEQRQHQKLIINVGLTLPQNSFGCA
jgi:hypothetical protein